MGQRGSGSQPWSAVISSKSDLVNWARNFASQFVKLFQRFGEAFHVFPVTVEHVEIDQVAEDQAIRALAKRLR